MQAKKNNPLVIGVKCREGRNVTVQPLPFCQVCISGPEMQTLTEGEELNCYEETASYVKIPERILRSYDRRPI